MSGKLSEKNNMVAFAQMMFEDSCQLPLVIFRDYREWGLSDRELAPFVRIVAQILRNGSINIRQISAEFNCPPEKANDIVQYFCSRQLLEYDVAKDSFTCQKLLNSICEKWLTGRRIEQTQLKAGQKEKTSRTNINSALERENLQQLSHLYRCFERDFGRNLRYTESDRLRNWLEDDKLPPDLIEEALRRASLQNKCSFAYIGSILDRWRNLGLHTLADVLENDTKATQTQALEKSAKARNTKTKKESKFSDVVDDLL